MIQCFKDKLVYVEVLFFLTLLVYTVQHIMVFGAVLGTCIQSWDLEWFHNSL